MSAPDTNIERQKRRHRGPLIGIILSLGFVAVLFIGYLVAVTDGTPPPGPDAVVVPATGY